MAFGVPFLPKKEFPQDKFPYPKAPSFALWRALRPLAPESCMFRKMSTWCCSSLPHHFAIHMATWPGRKQRMHTFPQKIHSIKSQKKRKVISDIQRRSSGLHVLRSHVLVISTMPHGISTFFIQCLTVHAIFKHFCSQKPEGQNPAKTSNTSTWELKLLKTDYNRRVGSSPKKNYLSGPKPLKPPIKNH